MQIGFMSSVSPRWDLDQLIAAARAHGYEAIEIRVEWGHAVGIELDSSREARRDARQKLADGGVALCCLALGTRFARATAAERDASVEQVARYAELAADLGAPLMRVFGGPVPEGTTVAELRDAAAGALGRAARMAADVGVTPCLETHDDFRDPADVAYVVEMAGHHNVGIVWHATHHLRLGIPVVEGYRALRPWIRHVHVNEGARPHDPENTIAPAIFGEGDGNVAEVVRVLKEDDYQGVVCWEWLNGRRGEYVDPSVYLEQNAERLREYAANE
ncbi:MAG: sugar phosphate isomerase/epimerase family protein [Thermomicrobiales bacterium]